LITALDMGRIKRLVFAHQNNSHARREAAQNLVLGIHEETLPLNVFGFG
jgi:hypothetical protein